MHELQPAPKAETASLLPVHIEWACSDLDRSEAFFGRVFLWSFEGDEHTRDASYLGQHVGSLIRSECASVATNQQTTVFVSVPSIDVALCRVVEEGGRIEQAKTASGGLGFEAVFSDLDGNRFGLFETQSAGVDADDGC